MKKFLINNKLETGQVLPLVVLMFFVLIGMAALILDGGSLMSNRRTAQAAADAGALAGAQRACLGKSDAKAVAETYARVNNGATTALATVTGKQVTVRTTVEHPSFFAKIFGKQTLNSSAEASAGCFGASGKGVVPMAWNCRAPSVGGGPFNPVYGCQIQPLSWKLIGPLVDPNWMPASERKTSVLIGDFNGQNPINYSMSPTYTKSMVDSAGIPPKQTYIIINSAKICIEDDPVTGAVICDLNGDGKKDIQVSGDRGWLYLTKGTSNIGDWIKNPPANFTLKPHTWLSGQSGVVESVYNIMVSENWVGKVVLVPVYNVLCENNPQTQSPPTCVTAAHASPWPAFTGVDDFSEQKNSGPYYHIIAFDPFYISCINTKGNCPGYKYAQIINPDKKVLDDNESVIEGYFLSDAAVSPDFTGDCVINLGNCTISLTK